VWRSGIGLLLSICGELTRMLALVRVASRWSAMGTEWLVRRGLDESCRLGMAIAPVERRHTVGSSLLGVRDCGCMRWR
jgi:hypothetical protein